MSGEVLNVAEGGRVSFRCPGCGDVHTVMASEGPGPRWTWNGDMVRPTLSPSVLMRSGHYAPGQGPDAGCWCTYNAERPNDPAPFSCHQCHSFVKDGQIQFLGDCSHALAGKTVPLPVWGGA